MSEHEDGDGGKTGAFLLGFLVGVLVSLGAGGAFFVVVLQRQQMEALRAQEAALVAREMAERARVEAEVHRERAEKALRDLKDRGKEKKP